MCVWGDVRARAALLSGGGGFSEAWAERCGPWQAAAAAAVGHQPAGDSDGQRGTRAYVRDGRGAGSQCVQRQKFQRTARWQQKKDPRAPWCCNQAAALAKASKLPAAAAASTGKAGRAAPRRTHPPPTLAARWARRVGGTCRGGSVLEKTGARQGGGASAGAGGGKIALRQGPALFTKGADGGKSRSGGRAPRVCCAWWQKTPHVCPKCPALLCRTPRRKARHAASPELRAPPLQRRQGHPFTRQWWACVRRRCCSRRLLLRLLLRLPPPLLLDSTS